MELALSRKPGNTFQRKSWLSRELNDEKEIARNEDSGAGREEPSLHSRRGNRVGVKKGVERGKSGHFRGKRFNAFGV